MKSMRNYIVGMLLVFFVISLRAEVQLVPFDEGSGKKIEIPTVFWKNSDAAATLIFLPGGKGSFGLTQKKDPQPTWVLKALHDMPTPPINIVFMDSNYSLQEDFGDSYSRWAPRRDSHHIEQIKHTISHYQKLFSKPVFLLGHSNGSLSIAEFLKQSPDNQKLVSGIIFSGSRNETEIGKKISVPVMVLHHLDDPNRWTTPGSAEQLFFKITQNNNSITEQAWVKGGKDISGGDPTHSGRHMYHEATSEAASLIQDFIKKVLGQ